MGMSRGHAENRASAMRGVIIRANPRVAEFGLLMGAAGQCVGVLL